MSQRFCFLFLFGLSTTVWATPGAVDKYDCHKASDTGEYHCHGSKEQARQFHVLTGVTSTNDFWVYDDGPYSLFSGVAAQLEIGWGSVATYAAYHYQWHATGSADFMIRGWDAGIKAGPGIARVGLHPYALAGYFSNTFDINGRLTPYSGTQYGGGLVFNRADSSFDLRVLYRNPQDLRAIWQQLGYPGLIANLNVQLGYHFRF